MVCCPKASTQFGLTIMIRNMSLAIVSVVLELFRSFTLALFRGSIPSLANVAC